jgi:PPK2 family polyphosphate:nucleotide phosphotransferase
VRVGPTDREQAAAEIFALEKETAQLHEMLWAQAKEGGPKALLVVFQGMDTSGKGGASKAVDRLLDPLGFSVVGFGVPTEEEKQHGFLWRHEQELPEAGRVKVFDRSHYEAVLVERVRGFASEEEWSGRYDQINAWEGGLVARGVTVLKCMLHISRDEQKERLLARLDDPDKHWKFNPADVDDRAYWDDYQAAFQDALVRCSTDEAPWFVVPADRKWHRDWLVSQLLLETMRGMGLSFPKSTLDVEAERARVQAS